MEASGGAVGPADCPHAIAPGVEVTLRLPWHLRRTRAIVRRRVGRGWEVEVRTVLGTPLHLVLPARALRRV
ncbi:hypothetical protein GCM10025783_28060 [Amnibacterium soli]|uniref:Uncharacterized protein n=1 Tax=Amnibacterium soli TaxID=1282736 RepID=A0ABP8ZDL9_9MICO